MPTFASIQFEIANMMDVADDLEPEKQQLMLDYLDELASMEANKVDAFVAFALEQKAKMDYCKAESVRLATKAATIAKSMEFLKFKYKETMQEHGLKKVSGNAYAISLRKSESVNITNPDLLGEDYLRRKEIVEPDKTAIKAAIKSGKEVPGAMLQENFSLQMR